MGIKTRTGPAVRATKPRYNPNICEHGVNVVDCSVCMELREVSETADPVIADALVLKPAGRKSYISTEIRVAYAMYLRLEMLIFQFESMPFSERAYGLLSTAERENLRERLHQLRKRCWDAAEEAL